MLFDEALIAGDHPRFEFLRALFRRHMLGMQMVNLLCDRAEDARNGQHWFPRSDVAPEAGRELLEKYGELGRRYMAEAAPLRDPTVVGGELATFFCALHAIFARLGALLARGEELEMR